GRTASTYSTPPVVTPEEEEMNTKQHQQERVIGKLNSEGALKSEASEDSKTLDDVTSDKMIEIIGQEDDWFNVIIDGQEGWMMSDTIDITNVKLVVAE